MTNLADPILTSSSDEDVQLPLWVCDAHGGGVVHLFLQPLHPLQHLRQSGLIILKWKTSLIQCKMLQNHWQKKKKKTKRGGGEKKGGETKKGWGKMKERRKKVVVVVGGGGGGWGGEEKDKGKTRQSLSIWSGGGREGGGWRDYLSHITCMRTFQTEWLLGLILALLFLHSVQLFSVHAELFCGVSTIHSTLTWTSGSLMCIRDLFVGVSTPGTFVYSLIWRTFIACIEFDSKKSWGGCKA